MDKRERCKDCIYLIEGNDGEWVCDAWDKVIDDVPDEACEAENSHFWNS